MGAAVTEHNQISQPPTRFQEVVDIAFRWLCKGFAWLFILLIAFIVLRIATSAVPALRHQGLGFLAGTTWDPNQEQYGILPEIWGTLYSSLLANMLGALILQRATVDLEESR